MNRCKSCGVNICGDSKICPLCFKSVNTFESTNSREYPSYNKSDKSIQHFGLHILSFVFLSISIISTIVNLLLWRGFPWFLLVLSSLGYVWVLIKNLVVSRSHFGTKIIIQLVGLSLLIFIIDIVNTGLSWSVDYVIPIFIIISNLLLTIRIIHQRIKWRDYSVYLIILISIGFIPIILYWLGFTHVFWPSITSAIYTLLTFLGFLMFSFNKFSREILKIFHL